MNTGYLQTGQTKCYDALGNEISCAGTGQDAESSKGITWPAQRFEAKLDIVYDRLTGLFWPINTDVAEFLFTWEEALDFVEGMNLVSAYGFTDWRLPNRRELRSLIGHQTSKPPLPAGHPFLNVFLGWYWTSTTAAISPAYAWYIHMEGGRMFYGRKDERYLAWPVRGENSVLPQTGQTECFDFHGRPIPCHGTGQDAAIRSGHIWPKRRFHLLGEIVLDALTGLKWTKKADLPEGAVCWSEALERVQLLNRINNAAAHTWRLPNINELESLVDCSAHNPALSEDHPFERVRDAYWSSTTSIFEPDWAWALYLDKGAIGVGHKTKAFFHVWAVAD